MMADPLDTIVVEYGETDSEDQGKLATDDEQNRIEQGISDTDVVPQWVQDTDFHILCQLPPGFVIDKIESTDTQVINNGLVDKFWTEERSFFATSEKRALNFRASGSTVAASHYGRASLYTIHNYLEISANSPPAIADITYSYRAYSLTIKAIDKADWPVGIVIHAVQG